MNSTAVYKIKFQNTKQILKSVVFLYIINIFSEKKKEIDPIYSSIKNNKILRNKFNWGEKLTLWKLQDTDEKNKREISRKVSCQYYHQ